MDRLTSDAWLLRGISSIPGELRLAAGVLSFTCAGTGSAWSFQLRKLGHVVRQPQLANTLEAGQRVEVFRWPANAITATQPWYYFGGGIVLRHQGITLRFSFGEPASSSDGIAAATAELREVRTMRQRGALWVKVLANAARSASLCLTLAMLGACAPERDAAQTDARSSASSSTPLHVPRSRSTVCSYSHLARRTYWCVDSTC